MHLLNEGYLSTFDRMNSTISAPMIDIMIPAGCPGELGAGLLNKALEIRSFESFA